MGNTLYEELRDKTPQTLFSKVQEKGKNLKLYVSAFVIQYKQL